MSFERGLQIVGLVSGFAGAAFWVYTFYAISKVPPGDHTGFQWLGEVPLTLIFLFMSVPAIACGFRQKIAGISAGAGLASLIAYYVIWSQLLTEFAGYK